VSIKESGIAFRMYPFRILGGLLTILYFFKIYAGIIVMYRSQWLDGLRREFCDRSLAGSAGSNPAGGMAACML
jgi:hypothetical protein